MSVDGRTARRNRNRDAVLDAAIELFSEGHIPPAPADVAARSGVSLRSVYRYFSDHDALVTSAVAQFVARNEALFDLKVAPEAPLGERIDCLVAARLRLYERVAPVARMAARRSSEVPVFAEQLDLRRQTLSEQTATLFAAELARAPSGILDAVDTLTQFDGVEHLRVHRRLSRARTRAALVTALQRLLDP